MNGLALHGGFIPYGGTFLVFTDYCRPSMRLSALMNQRVIYVMTHDSIGLGEDGPTHQPVEHLASLRAIPNLQVFRPGDAVETAECWALALASAKAPSVLSLSAAGCRAVAAGVRCRKQMRRGADMCCANLPKATRRSSLSVPALNSGWRLRRQNSWKRRGLPRASSRCPAGNCFDAQPESYRTEVLGGEGTVRIAIEAALGFGWERYLGSKGAFIGMKGFGASAPAEELYAHFGITAEAAVTTAKRLLGS